MRDIPEAEKISYISEDGIHLSAIWQETNRTAKGVIILAHGITDTKDEKGLFVVLADALAKCGFHSLRFDFRGHGESEGAQENVTLHGEQLDLAASVTYAWQRSSLPLGIVAFSLGAVSACCFSNTSSLVVCLVLWSPVLDLRCTFLEPELPWARQSFNPQGFAFLKQHGYLWLDNSFKIGQKLVDEMAQVFPYKCLSQLQIPVLTLHGNRDTCVPYEVSRLYGVPNHQSRFMTVPASEHDFGRIQDQKIIIPATVEWFLSHIASNYK